MRIARGIEQMLMGLSPTPLSILNHSIPDNNVVAAWYRSDMGITIGTGVAAWADQSGNGRHLLQAVAGAQPALVAGATPNGKPVLRFDGSADFLRVASWGLVQPNHVIITAKWTYQAGARYLFDGSTIGTGCVYTAGTLVGYQFAGGVAGNRPFTDATWYVWDALFNGASSAIGLNGGAVSTGNVGAGNMGGFTVGASGNVAANFSIADVSEIIIVNRAMTAAERAAINAYKRAWSGV